MLKIVSGTTRDGSTSILTSLRSALSSPPQLSPVLHRTKPFAHRHLDDTSRDELADLSHDELRLAARFRWLRRTDPGILHRPICRCVGGSMGPAAHSENHA